MELFLNICGVQSICFRIPDERISDMSGLLIEPRVMVERHWIACNVFPPNALIIFATVDPSKTERFIFPEWSHKNRGQMGRYLEGSLCVHLQIRIQQPLPIAEILDYNLFRNFWLLAELYVYIPKHSLLIKVVLMSIYRGSKIIAVPEMP